MGWLQEVGSFLSQNVIKPVAGYVESIVKPIREGGIKAIPGVVSKVAGDIGNVLGSVSDVAEAIANTNVPGVAQIASTVASAAKTGKGISKKVSEVAGGLNRALNA